MGRVCRWMDQRMPGRPRIELRASCAAWLSMCERRRAKGRRTKGYIHVSDPDVQVRRMRHAEIVRKSLGDVVREKWKSGDSAKVGREDDPTHAALLRTGACEPVRGTLDREPRGNGGDGVRWAGRV